MRSSSEALHDVLAASISRRLIADVFNGPDRVIENADLTGWQLDGDLTAEVKYSGSASIVYSSPDGSSYVPNGTDGVLSPYRAKLLLKLEISALDFVETVTLGWFKVTACPSAYDRYYEDQNTGEKIVSASVVQIDFQSLDVQLKRRGFRSPEQAPSLVSCFDELRRITDMPVNESVSDAPMPKAIVYEAKQGGRLQAVQSIAATLGGVAVPDSSGALTIIKPGGATPVGSLEVGPLGTVTDVGYSIDTDEVYNVVVGTGTNAKREPLWSAIPATGDLDPSGLYGENTLYFESKTATTQAQLDAETTARLNQSIGGQTYEVPIQCIINPLPELGDVLEVVGHDRPIVGQCVKLSLSNQPLMDVTLEVARPLV